MVNIELDIPKEWFAAEIRGSDFISREKKELWAIQLDMVYKVQQICEKYKIKYFADAGTMLGAVRHRGFIPWDDDIDIMMPAEDYDKFIEIAKKELQHPYFLQTDWTDECCYCHAKIRRTDTTGILAKDISAKFNFNQGIFIDIFPMEYVPENEEEYRSYIDHLWMIKKEMLLKRSRWWLYERDNDALHDEIIGLREYYNVLRRKYQNSGSKTIANLSLPSLQNEIRKDMTLYNDVVYAPFEMLRLPIPKNFNSILTRQYGDYMTPVRGSSCHGDVLIDTNMSYKDTPIIKTK